MKLAREATLDCLTSDQKDAFRQMVGEDRFFLNPQTCTCSSIEEAVDEVLVSLIEKRKDLVSQFELVDYQQEQIDKTLEVLGNDPAYLATEAKIDQFESQMRNGVQIDKDGLKKAMKSNKLAESRILRAAATETKEILLPQQSLRLKQIAIRTYINQSKLFPCEWPLKLSDELKLNEQQKALLHATTKSSAKKLATELDAIEKELFEKVKFSAPSSLRTELEQLIQVRQLKIELSDFKDPNFWSWVK
jgi:hypothetical protein